LLGKTAAPKLAREIRFAVGSREDVRSSIWRLWANGDDLYLAARSFAAASKVSFHKSGIYRYAANSDTPRPALLTRRRKTEIFPGWTVVFAILIPPRITAQPLKDVLRNNKPVVFISEPISGRKAVIQILLSGKPIQGEGLARLLADPKITVLDRIEMPTQTAWLTSFYDAYTTKEQAAFMDHFNKLKIHLKPGQTGAGLSASLHIFELADRPFLVDIQLGKENLDFGQRGP
jgi:hypothetical protein